MEIKVSLYQSAKDNTGTETTLDNIFKLFTDKKLKKYTDKLRNELIPPYNEAAKHFDLVYNENPAACNQWEDIVKAFIQIGRKNDKNPKDEKILAEYNRIHSEYEAMYKNEFISKYLDAKKEKSERSNAISFFKTTYFPAATWSGTFTKRSIEGLQQHSGLLCIDIDKLTEQELQRLLTALKQDQHTFLLFVSPSGNGLKIIFKIKIAPHENNVIQQHEAAFLSVEKYFFDVYNVRIDVSGKDVSRLCFLPFDADYYININSSEFVFNANAAADTLPKQKKAATTVQKLSKQESDTLRNTELTANDVWEFTQNISTYTDGNRNNFIHLYACNCNRKGLPETEALNFALQFGYDMSQKEIEATVHSAYKQNTNEHGKFAKRSKRDRAENGAGYNPIKNVPQKSTNPVAEDNTNSNATTAENGNVVDNNGRNGNAAQPEKPGQKEIRFWYITENVGKDGKVSKNFNIDYNKLKQFLQQHGFYRLPMDDNYQFIKVTGNRVKPVQPLHIRDYIFHYLESKNENDACNYLTKGGKQYLSTDKFERLAYKEISLKKHTEDSAFFYYKNGIVEVTRDDIKLIPYNQLNDEFIWEKAINEREVTIIQSKDENDVYPEEVKQGEIYRFVWLACCNQGEYIDKQTKQPKDIAKYNEFIKREKVVEKFAAHCSGIGYMMHQYKNPSNSRAVLAIDHKIPEDRNEQNGRTGKSILGKYILGNMVNIATIPGKTYKEDNPWKWEPITIDSQIVFFNDVKRNFSFEDLFELIADDLVINRRNIGYLKISSEDSPKVFVATNFTPKLDGDSFTGRVHLIEFDDYFNAQYTPYNEFGHNLFTNWKGKFANQWNLYDNFVLRCVQMYLQEGLVPYPGGNYEQRRLVSECPPEFIDFMNFYLLATESNAENPLKGKVPNTNKWLEKKELMKLWTSEAKDYNLPAPSAHQFTKYVKRYVATQDFALHTRKTAGKEYYCFGTPPASSPLTNQQQIF